MRCRAPSLLTMPWLVLAACPEVQVAEDAGGAVDAAPSPDAASPDAGQLDSGVLPACAPTLVVRGERRAVLPLSLLRFLGEGGTGAHRFRFRTNGSGAILNELTGAYVSGMTRDVSDVVELSDLGCAGTATTAVRVVPALELSPRAVELRPRQTFRFDAVGGSGQLLFELVTSASGGTLAADGTYGAGAQEGVDRVRLTDEATGETLEAMVTVSAAASLAHVPARVSFPLGQTFRLRLRGGSGVVELARPAARVRLDDGALATLSTGRETLRLRDRYTQDETDLEVSVLPPLSWPARRAGDGLNSSTVLAAGDLDGDGRAELLFAHPEADLGSYNGGALLLYAGVAGGFTTAPAWTVAGAARSDELGRALAVADLDADGISDVALGVPRLDEGAIDSGAVYLYYGTGAAGYLEAEPRQVLRGRFGSDLFGWALAVCDFNADGKQDLAAGAWLAEDRGRATVSSDQGGVFLFLGRDGPFPAVADQVIWGDVPDGAGGFVGRSDLRLGHALAAADFDGDGACDLFASSLEYDQGASDTDDGLVAIYRGRRASSSGPGGLEAHPALLFANDDPGDTGGQLGRALAGADLDGDGKAELIVGHPFFDSGGLVNRGAARVVRGRELSTQTATAARSPAQVDWVVMGNDASDTVGYMVRAADVTGDGRADLLLGNELEEVMGGPGNGGTVAIYPGRPGQLPEQSPTRVLTATTGGEYFGAAFDAVGDMDGDGAADLAVLSVFSDRGGRDVGRLDFRGSVAGAGPVPLELPGDVAGARFGQGADFVGDVNGDGLPDLAVSAAWADDGALGLNTGEVHLYLGTGSGFGPSAALSLKSFPGHSANDWFGWAVAGAGDFDGDGVEDLAVVSRLEDKPATLDAATYAVDASCQGVGALTNDGAVYVFRGARAGLPATRPMLVFYSPVAGEGLQAVGGRFDADGDGRGDLIIGAPDWDRPGAANAGAALLLRGRAADPGGKIVAVCAADFAFRGQVANDRLGTGVAGVGDVDGDGCGDFAAGVPNEDFGLTDQGGLRLFFGWGGAGCPGAPLMAVFGSLTAGAQAGYSLAGGADLDGDGRPELAVGMPTLSSNGGALGGALVVQSDYLRGAPREPAQDGALPVNRSPLVNPGRPQPILTGEAAGERFGSSLALVSTGTVKALLVGAPLGPAAGPLLSGGARVHDFDPVAGLAPTPRHLLGGETTRAGGRLGEWVAVGPGSPWAVAGGYDGQGIGVDLGAAVALEVR